MDLARRVYSRELKVSVMRQIDGGRTPAELARQFQLSPKLLEKWRTEWRAKGPEVAFPGNGQRAEAPILDQGRRIAELERKIGQLTMENDYLKKALRHFKEQHPPAVVNGGAACLRKSGKKTEKAKP
jgi:transposase-like protein